jgi:hypothetical protein
MTEIGKWTKLCIKNDAEKKKSKTFLQKNSVLVLTFKKRVKILIYRKIRYYKLYNLVYDLMLSYENAIRWLLL